MDVVPPAGAVCARLGSEAQIADTATMPAVTANPKLCPVKLDFDDMVDSRISDTSSASPMNWSNRYSAKWPVIVVNLMSPYSGESISVNRANGRPVAPRLWIFSPSASRTSKRYKLPVLMLMDVPHCIAMIASLKTGK